ncbi:hypothetical protein QVG61_05865 [Thiohalobacter sp. IOR34]|uniref:hypothetical protein n=1 Tax=Thiohalobacter sp. IOR34 TaxID=3057176 RepID=UPI0025AF85D7|nr:hypothetical protein [Thiohalobacter sp. IOR34]WJW76615.1 hypothetical protein QVG61_05865 [Thiohalobacter sp. IOR34]
MPQSESPIAVLIVITVLLFFFLGIAILVLIDHKARLPGGFTHDPFSISGIRRDHPVIAFLTTTILVAIIGSLALELLATLYETYAKPRTEKEEPTLMSAIEAQRKHERIRHFHNISAEIDPTRGQKAVCLLCHGDFPHSKERMIRTILNMHTQFIGCMTCHNDPRLIPESSLSFGWLNYSGIEVDGPHFGTDINQQTGDLIETDDYYSKIVAYSDGQLLEITPDRPEAREFYSVYKHLSDRDREAVKERFHKLVTPKGRFCSRCHNREEPYLDFSALGFTEQRQENLTNLNIIGLVEKYKKFYIPNLLKSKKSLPPLENLTGHSSSKVLASPDDRNRQKPWWEKTDDRTR